MTPEESQALRRELEFLEEMEEFESLEARQPKNGDISDPLLHGITLGASDELGGLGSRIAGMLHGDTWAETGEAYDTTVAEKRRDLEAFRARNPATALGAEFLGGLITGGGTAKLATSVPKLLALGAAEGAFGGAASSTEGNRTGGALLGGGLGLGLSSIVPTGQLIGNVPIIKNKIVDPLLNKIADSPSTGTSRVISEGFEGMTPEQLRSEQIRLGPEATPADIGGSRTMGLTQGAIGESPSTRTAAIDLSEARRAGQPQRVREGVTEAMGGQQRYLDKFDEVKGRQRQQSRDAYDLAYSRRIIPDEELVEILNRPAIRKSLNEAYEDALNEGRQLPQLEKIIMQGDDIRFTKDNIPDMEVLDTIKQDLDKSINRAYSGANPDAKLGKSLSSARNALKDKLDRLNPDYAAARSIYAGDQALLDSLETGEKFLTMKTREVGEYLRGLTPSEKESFLTGATESIREKMGRARGGSLSEFNFLETANAREKLRMLFPDGSEGTRKLNKLMDTLKRERMFAENETAWTKGAQTDLRTAGRNILRKDASGIGVADIVTDPVRSSVAVAREGADALLTSQSQKVIDEVGRVLMTTNNIEEVIQIMAQKGIDPDTVRKIVRGIQASGQGLSAAVPTITMGRMEQNQQGLMDDQ